MTVTVYTQPNCLPCKRVIRKLQEANIDLEVIDISLNVVAKDYVTRCLHVKSTPVVEADWFNPIVCYQPDLLKGLIDALT